MASKHPKFDELVALTAETLGATTLAQMVVNSLIPGGAQSEWEAETIELVLQPFEQLCETLEIPWVGNSELDGAHEFWGELALEVGVETDWEAEDEEDDDEEEADDLPFESPDPFGIGR